MNRDTCPKHKITFECTRAQPECPLCEAEEEIEILSNKVIDLESHLTADEDNRP